MKQGYQRTILQYLARYRLLAIPGMVVMLLITAGQLAGPYILKLIIDNAVPRGDLGLLLQYALAFLGIVTLTGVLSYFGQLLLARLGLSIVTLIKEDLFNHLLKLPVSYFDQHPVGELMARTENDTERVRELFSTLGVSLLVNFLTMLGIFVVTFTIVPMLALVMLGVAVVLFVLLSVFFAKIFPLYDQSRSLYAMVNARVTEFIQGVEVLKAFGRRRWAEARLDETGQRKMRNDVRISLFEYSAMSALNALVGPLFIVALLLLYAPEVIGGAMTLGTLLLFVEYGARLLRPIAEIAESLRSLQQARTSLRRICSIMALPEEAHRGEGDRPDFQHDLVFDHVWFAYRDEDWILKDLSFSIPKGSFTAIVGPSGSGKSTIISLLCAFAHPQRGAILVDGRPLREADVLAWRRKIGLVLQEPYLFPGELLENIRLYNRDIPEQKVQKALERVHASHIVASLPDGLAANLWERGGNLSAGERQLMSFARALAADPELIILDEATSNVDMHTEERIKESIGVLRQGRTMVVVAHRLSSILEADRILFLREGRLIAEGTHAELYAALPEYRTLVDQQFPSNRSRQGRHAADELEVDPQGIFIPVGRGSGSTGSEA